MPAIRVRFAEWHTSFAPPLPEGPIAPYFKEGRFQRTAPTIPLSLIDVQRKFPVLILARGDVVEFSRYRFLFPRGLRIVHRRNDLPQLLLFYSVDGYETLMQLLQKLGYPVKETCSAV